MQESGACRNVSRSGPVAVLASSSSTIQIQKSAFHPVLLFGKQSQVCLYLCAPLGGLSCQHPTCAAESCHPKTCLGIIFMLDILENFFQKGLSGTRTGCPGQWWNSHFWRDLTDMWTWQLGAWVSAGLGSAGGIVRLYGLKGLFQPKPSCDSAPFGCKKILKTFF